jgi:hypothetical protein
MWYVFVLSLMLIFLNIVVNKDIHNIYKTVQGSEPSHTQYLQSYSGERTSTYTIFTKLFRGEN